MKETQTILALAAIGACSVFVTVLLLASAAARWATCRPLPAFRRLYARFHHRVDTDIEFGRITAGLADDLAGLHAQLRCHDR